MNARDELATIIGEQFEHGVAPNCQVCADVDRAAAAVEVMGYRKPRTITTVEELDALPLRSLVRDSDGEPWELTDNGWRYWVYDEAFHSLEITLPVMLLHEGQA